MIASLSGLAVVDLAEIVARCDDDATALRGARVLVTGATGWFGTWLLDALVALSRARALDLRIVAVSRDPAHFAARLPLLAAAREIQWVAGDLRDPALAVAGSVTHVIHAGAESSTTLTPSSRDTMFETIVEGTRNVLRMAQRADASRLLFVSSGAVYGPREPDAGPVDEAAHVAGVHAPTGDPYVDGKRAAERLLADASNARCAVVVARCFAFVGPHMPLDAHFAIGNFIRDVARDDDVRVRSDGTLLRSYLYMGDLVRWLLRLLVAGRAGRAYNVGSAESLSIAELARRCAAQAHPPARVRIDGAPAGAACDYVPDTRRATNELGLDVRVGIDDAIVRTLAWSRSMAAVAGPRAMAVVP